MGFEHPLFIVDTNDNYNLMYIKQNLHVTKLSLFQIFRRNLTLVIKQDFNAKIEIQSKMLADFKFRELFRLWQCTYNSKDTSSFKVEVKCTNTLHYCILLTSMTPI